MVTPVLFAVAGFWLDSRFGTGPVFAILFVRWRWSASPCRAYYGYIAAMAKEEEGKPWKRQPATVRTSETSPATRERGLMIAAPFVLVAGLLRGFAGAVGVGIGLGVVVFNYLVAGDLGVVRGQDLQDRPVLRSPPCWLACPIRGGLLALFLLHDRSLIDFPTLGIALVGEPSRPAHVGGEARHDVARLSRSQTQQTRTLGRRMTVLALGIPADQPPDALGRRRPRSGSTRSA